MVYGARSVGQVLERVCDITINIIYLDKHLHGAFLEKVLCHELCHVFCFSYHIHMGLEQEEFLANWIATYGRDVIELLDNILYTIHNKNVPTSICRQVAT